MDYKASLNTVTIRDMCRRWIQEDIPSHIDIGGMVVGTRTVTAHLYMKESGVLAGMPFFQETFNALEGVKVEWMERTDVKGGYKVMPAEEGRKYEYNGKPILLATVTGPCNQILRGERTALCALSRCSGVASDSRTMVTKAREIGWEGRVAGTRKTTPGFRVVEKYGLMVGGADTHRLDLSHMVMLKDNHIWATGGDIGRAVKTARLGCGFSSKIEVECRTLSEAVTACESGADVVMLDNMTGEEVRDNATKIKERFGGVVVEASGGITVESMGEYAGKDVDVMSCGRLTQGYKCLDFSLKVQQE